jgi:hypothetical protein
MRKEMARIFTQEELEIINQAEQLLKLRGVITEDGNPSAVHNLKLLVTPFDKNPSSPVTVDGLISVANQLADKLYYISKPAKQLTLSRLTSEEMDVLREFLARKPLAKLDGSNDGYHNAVLLVEWLRRYNYPINFEFLSKAMDGFTYSQSTDPNQLLRWLETPRTTPRGRWSQDDDPNRKPGQLFTEPVKTDGPRYRGGRLDHSTDTRYQQKPAAPVLDQTEQAWKKLADQALQNGPQHHSAKEARQEAYDVALGNGASYRKVYEAVKKVINQQETVKG